jgi:hypothetical protein
MSEDGSFTTRHDIIIAAQRALHRECGTGHRIRVGSASGHHAQGSCSRYARPVTRFAAMLITVEQPDCFRISFNARQRSDLGAGIAAQMDSLRPPAGTGRGTRGARIEMF